MNKELVVKMVGLIALVMSDTQPWHALLLDPDQAQHESSHVTGAGDNHVSILAINLKDTQSTADLAIDIPGGGSLGLWRLDGYQMRIVSPKATPRPAMATRMPHQGNTPTQQDAGDIDWIPSLEFTAGVLFAKAHPDYIKDSAPRIISSRVVIDAGKLAAIWNDLSNTPVYEFKSDDGTQNTTKTQAIADGVSLTSQVTGSDPWPQLVLTDMRGAGKPTKTIILSPKAGSQVTVTVSCLPSPLPARPGDLSRIPHFAHYYSVSKQGQHLGAGERPYPRRKPPYILTVETVPCTPGVLR